jgi:hypothetical protein
MTPQSYLPLPVFLWYGFSSISVTKKENRQATKICCERDSIIDDLVNLVEAKYRNDLKDGGVGHLYVYPPGTPLDALNANDRLRPGDSVPGGTTQEQPLMVMAPRRILTLWW